MRYGLWLGNGKSGGSYTGGPFRLVIHTTETSGLPGYNGGLSAPHITYDPAFGNFYQHTEFSTAARALANPSGGVQTNRRSALQLEVICYSNKTIADQAESRTWVGDLTDQNYFDIREFIDLCHEEYGVGLFWPGNQALSYSQANAPGFRLSGSEWDSFGGICGHQHVPENTHWDPGALDWDRLVPDMTPEQEAKLDEALELLRQLKSGLAIDYNTELEAWTLRHTDSNLSHFLRRVTAPLVVDELVERLED